MNQTHGYIYIYIYKHMYTVYINVCMLLGLLFFFASDAVAGIQWSDFTSLSDVDGMKPPG